MEISLINIGNSKGIRLAKTIIEKYDFQDKIELIMEDDYLILRPKTKPRKDWDKSFEEMHRVGDDRLLIDDFFSDEDSEEWS